MFLVEVLSLCIDRLCQKSVSFDRAYFIAEIGQAVVEMKLSKFNNLFWSCCDGC